MDLVPNSMALIKSLLYFVLYVTKLCSYLESRGQLLSGV